MKLFVVSVFLFLLAVEAKGLEKVMSDYVDFDIADISDGGKHTESRIKKRSVIAVDPKEVLNYLNEVRGKVKSKVMKELNWNYTLAKSAKALVMTCEFRPTDRSTRPQYDRIIHSSFGKTKAKDYKEVVDAWYEGTKNFYPSSPKCTGLCTDYLMLTRSDFDRVGCAANECDDLKKGSTSETDALFMACYFFSTVNDSFLQPNSKGDYCAECGAKFKLCMEGLCTRDHPKTKYPLKNSNGKVKRSEDEDNTMSSKDNTMSTKDNTMSTKDNTMSSKDNTMPAENNSMSTNDRETGSPGTLKEVTKPVDSPGDPIEKLPDIPETTTTKKIPPRPEGEDLHEITEGVPVMPTTTKGPEEIPEREPPEQKISFAPVAPIKSGVRLGIQKTSNKLLILNILLVIAMTKSI